MEPGIIILREITQAQKNSMFSLIPGSWIWMCVYSNVERSWNQKEDQKSEGEDPEVGGGIRKEWRTCDKNAEGVYGGCGGGGAGGFAV